MLSADPLVRRSLDHVEVSKASQSKLHAYIYFILLINHLRNAAHRGTLAKSSI